MYTFWSLYMCLLWNLMIFVYKHKKGIFILLEIFLDEHLLDWSSLALLKYPSLFVIKCDAAGFKEHLFISQS